MLKSMMFSTTVVLAVSAVLATMDLAQLKKHNELETKEERLNEIMSKIDHHCEAVALNKTGT